MPDYRRNRVPGGSYFFTVNLQERASSLLTDQVATLREVVARVRRESPFHIDAWVVLPNHLHCVWTLPAGDSDPKRWRAIKTLFSIRMARGEYRCPTRIRRGERGLWQKRYWEHTIRDDGDYARHVDYVHFNPVKHGLAANAADWRYSTFRRCVTLGMYPPDWSGEGT